MSRAGASSTGTRPKNASSPRASGSAGEPSLAFPAAVRAAGLSRTYGRISALDGVDLELAPGMIGALLGPNGAGKTTLLSILGTIEPADSGRAWIAGRDVAHERRAVRSLVGYVGHEPLLYPDLTLLENLRFFATLYGCPVAEDAMTRLIETVGLADQADRRVRTLSHGSVRKASIARALIHDPPVLLADEPYSGLDPDAAADLDDLLRRLASAGATILLSSHDVERVRQIAQSITVLDRGRVTWHGPAEAFGGWRAWRDAGSHEAQRSAQTPAQSGSTTHTAAPDRPQPSFGATVRALVAKDVRTESRARQFVPLALVYGLLLAVLVHFAMPADGPAAALLFPGTLWVSLVFGTTLGFGRAASFESEGGAAMALAASPADPGALFLGKWLGGTAFSALVALVLIPATAMFLNLPSIPLAPVAAVTALGLVGWAAAGTLIAAMAARAGARDALAPLILLPLAMPLLISAMHATAALMDGASLAAPLTLIAAYDVIFLVGGFLAYGPVLEAGR